MSARITPDLRARLEDAARGGLREEGDTPLARAGRASPPSWGRFELIVEPPDGACLSAVIAALDAARVPAAILGAGTKHWLGNPLRDVRVGVSTLGVAGVDELDEADGVVRVGCGTRLDELAGKAAAAGWLLPLDTPGRGGTVGGALATALGGPRRLGFGPVRDVVLGLDTVLANGDATRCGARVVKNVTGYDLAKLYVGSLGTLGVMERAWLRLRAAPASVVVLHATFEEAADIHTHALRAARLGTARAVAFVSERLIDATDGFPAAPDERGRYRLIAELAGDAPATEQDAGWLVDELGAEACPASAIDALRALQCFVDPIGVRARIHALPTALAGAARVIERAGGRVMVNPVPGSVTCWFEAELDDGEDPWWLDRVLGTIDEARGVARGEAVVEALPAWGHGRRDVFGGSGALSLMRSLKDRFDPNVILNPGRFVGSI